MDHGTKRTIKGLGTVKGCHTECDNWETDDNPEGGKEKLPRVVGGTTLIVRGFEAVGVSAGGIPRVGKFKHTDGTKNSTITS